MQSNNQMTDKRYSMRLYLKEIGCNENFINGYMQYDYIDNNPNPIEQYCSFVNNYQNTQNNVDNFELDDNNAIEYLNNSNRNRNDRSIGNRFWNMFEHNNNRRNRNRNRNRNRRHINNRRNINNINNRRNSNYRRNSNSFFDMLENMINPDSNTENDLMFTTTMTMGPEEMVIEQILSSDNNPINIIESLLPMGFSMVSGMSLGNRLEQLLQRSFDNTSTYHDVLENNVAEELKNKNTYSYNELASKNEDIDKDNCSVCLESIKPESDNDNSYNKKVLIKLPCEHVFHTVCVMKWLTEGDHRCPVCRKSCGNHHKVN